MIGQTVSHFRITEKLGEGGMGEVYLAQDTSLDRKVALKFLPPLLQDDLIARRRFVREAKSAAALDHPFICNIHEVAQTEEGEDFIVMEYVEGLTLREKLDEGRLPMKEALRIASEVAEALEKAHQAGIVHRDLKPANIMLTQEGHAKVMDFGLAKRLGRGEGIDQGITSALTQAGSTLGTLAYMSPEQVRAEPVSQDSDIFSFGIIFYEMLTGVHPFRRETFAETASAILNDDPPPLGRFLSTFPGILEHMIKKLLAKEPPARYRSIHEVHTNLIELRERPEGIVAKIPRSVKVAVLSITSALLIVSSALWIFKPSPSGVSPGRITSIAVLPLENLMHDRDQDYFVEGMHEALITNLCKIGALRVISRTSMQRYKGTGKPLSQIAAELGVDVILEGSVLRVGDQVRVTAQLIDGQSDTHLWADSFERQLSNILLLQSEVAQSVAASISAVVTPEEHAHLSNARLVSPEAHEAYLKGRYFFRKFSREGFTKAIEYFQEAIEKSPNSPLGYAGLSTPYAGLAYWGYVPPKESLPKARAAALKALEIDDSVGEAHAMIGGLKLYFEWDWANAEKEFKRAIELDPSSSETRMSYALCLGATGRLDEGLAEALNARTRDPLSPGVSSVVAQLLLAKGELEQALEYCQESLVLNPDFFILHWLKWRILWLQERPEEALIEARTSFYLRGNTEVGEALDRGFAEAGYQGAMRAAAWKQVEQSKLGYVPPTDVALCFVQAEEKEQALEWLEKAWEERDFRLHTLGMDPDWKPLRKEPRFLDLLNKMKLPEGVLAGYQND